MVAIILTILKIIGIVLLVILCVALVLLLAVTFIPVRYKAKGTYQEKEIQVRATATWFLHILSAAAIYQNGQPFHIYAKIFGIRIFDNLRPIKKKDRNKKGKKTKNKSNNVGEIRAASLSNTIEDSLDHTDEDNEFITKSSDPTEMTRNTPSFDQSFDQTQDSPKKENIFQKIKQIISKFVNFFRNITFTFHKICDTMNRIKKNLSYYLQLLQQERTKQAFFVCKNQLVRIVKKVMPKICRVHLHLGFEDPAVMGEILAVWGMFYPFHQGAIDIQPEFDKEVIEGDFYLKGRINIYIFIQAICVFLFDKNIKHVIKHLKAE